jgi:putative tricarboxylic transport membrane protein
MNRPISEIVVHLVLMGLAGYFLVESFSIRGSAAGGSLSPAFFPKAICTLLLVLLSVSLLQLIYAMATHKAEKDEVSFSRSAVIPVVSWFVVLSLLIIYAVALEWLGYVVSTTLLVFCVVGTLVILSPNDESRVSAKGIAQLGAFSITVSLSIFFLFSQGFGIILPTLGIMGV